MAASGGVEPQSNHPHSYYAKGFGDPQREHRPMVGDGGVEPHRQPPHLYWPTDFTDQCGEHLPTPYSAAPTNSLIIAGTEESKPATSSIPESVGSAIEKLVAVIPITISFASIPVLFLY